MESLLAALKARLVPVNVNYRYREDELAYGGAALLVGAAGPETRRAALWLARTRGVRRDDLE